MEENNNRQRDEWNAKAQADSRARAQAEAQRKVEEDLHRHNSTDDSVHPTDDYFQLSSSIPHFSYAQSPSFGAWMILPILLTCSLMQQQYLIQSLIRTALHPR